MKTTPNNPRVNKNVFLSSLKTISFNVHYVLFFLNFSNKDKLYESCKSFLESTKEESKIVFFESQELQLLRFCSEKKVQITSYQPRFPGKKVLPTNLFQINGKSFQELDEVLTKQNEKLKEGEVLDDQRIFEILTKQITSQKDYSSFYEQSILRQGGYNVSLSKLLFSSKNSHFVTPASEFIMKEAENLYEEDLFYSYSLLKKKILKQVIDLISESDICGPNICDGKGQELAQPVEGVIQPAGLTIEKAQEQNINTEEQIKKPLDINQRKEIDQKNVQLSADQQKTADQQKKVTQKQKEEEEKVNEKQKVDKKKKTGLFSKKTKVVEEFTALKQDSVNQYGIDLIKQMIKGKHYSQNFRSHQAVFINNKKEALFVTETLEHKENPEFIEIFSYEDILKTGLIFFPQFQSSQVISDGSKQKDFQTYADTLSIWNFFFGHVAEEIKAALTDLVEYVKKKITDKDYEKSKIKKFMLKLNFITSEKPVNIFPVIHCLQDLLKIESIKDILFPISAQDNYGDFLKNSWFLFDKKIPIEKRIIKTIVLLHHLDQMFEEYKKQIQKGIQRFLKAQLVTEELVTKATEEIEKINFSTKFDQSQKDEVIKLATAELLSGQQVIPVVRDELSYLLYRGSFLVDLYIKTFRKFELKNIEKYSPIIFEKFFETDILSYKTTDILSYQTTEKIKRVPIFKYKNEFKENDSLIVSEGHNQKIILNKIFSQRIVDFPNRLPLSRDIMFFAHEEKNVSIMKQDKEAKGFKNFFLKLSKKTAELTLQEKMDKAIEHIARDNEFYCQERCIKEDCNVDFQILDALKSKKYINDLLDVISSLPFPKNPEIILLPLSVVYLKNGKNKYNTIKNKIVHGGFFLQQKKLVLGAFAFDVELKKTIEQKTIESVEKVLKDVDDEKKLEEDIKNLKSVVENVHALKMENPVPQILGQEDQDVPVSTGPQLQKPDVVQTETVQTEQQKLDTIQTATDAQKQLIPEDKPQTLSKTQDENNPHAKVVVLFCADDINICKEESALQNNRETLLTTLDIISLGTNYIENLVSATSADWLLFSKSEKLLKNVHQIQNMVNEKKEEIALKSMIKILCKQYVVEQIKSFFNHSEGEKVKNQNLRNPQDALKKVENLEKFCNLSLDKILKTQPKEITKTYFEHFSEFEYFFYTHILDFFTSCFKNKQKSSISEHINSLEKQDLVNTLEDLSNKIKAKYICGMLHGQYINIESLTTTLLTIEQGNH